MMNPRPSVQSIIGVLPCLILLCTCLLAGCDTKAPGGDTAPLLLCSDSDTPYLLHSKIDDDDGDGNPFDEDFPAINDEDDDIADHCWIRDDSGRYHLFFHNEGHLSGSAIEHYISGDLQELEYAGVALRPDPGGWDRTSVWAPHIIRHENTYYMFYTGVDGTGADARQRIGLATSEDLFTWTRWRGNNCPGTAGRGCVYECRESWTAWGAGGGTHDHQCRDPFVIRDTARRRWLLFATAKSTNGYGVITVARSGDLLRWSGAGFIDATRRLEGYGGARGTGGQAENPFITLYDNTYYLFFTDWQDGEDTLTVPDPRTIAQYATTPALAVDSLGSAAWIYRGYIPDPGVNAIEILRITPRSWIMSQSIANERSGLWEHRRELRLKCIDWLGGFSFTTSNVETPFADVNSIVRPAAVAPAGARPVGGNGDGDGVRRTRAR